MSASVSSLLHDAVYFIYYGDPMELLLLGVALLFSASLIETATRFVENGVRLLGVLLIIVAIVRILGFSLPPPPF